MDAPVWSKHFIKFWMIKGPKNTMKTTFLPPFAPAGSTFGRIIFGGENDLQIGKFHLGWIANIQGFLKRYHVLNLDVGKCPKSRLKGALRIWLRRATYIDFWSIFHLPAQDFGQLDQFFLWM